MSENNASAKPRCDHHWGTTVHNRMSITRCSLKGCGDYNWAEMREQLDRELGRGYAAAIADVVAWLRKTGDWCSDIPDNEQCGHGNWSWEGCETCGIKGAADAIERGEAKGEAK